MNKKFLVCLLSLFCFLLLLSCENPKYVGQWHVGKESLSEIVEALTSEYLEEYGIDSSDSENVDTLVGQIEYELMDKSDDFDILLDLKENGKCLISLKDSSLEATYSVSKDNVLTLTADDESIEFGSFNEDYTKLTIDECKASLGFVLPMEKKTADSKELVYLWPEIEKGEEASLETVKTLVMNGADVNYGINDDGERLFFAAISEECPEDIVLYLVENTDPKYINACNEDYGTALLEALSYNEKASYNIVKALLDAGADVGMGKSWGYHPLHYAIKYCSEEIALEVIAKATSEQINERKYDTNCLGIALSKGEKASVAVVKALLDAGADITFTLPPRSLAYDPLHYAIKYCSEEIALEVIAKATAEQVNMLNSDMTCLGFALSKGEKASVAVVKALLDAGSDASIGEGFELSADKYARKYCSEEISLLLRERGTAPQGNFVRLDSEEFAIVSEEELTGAYSNSDGITDGILKFTIEITDNKTQFVLREEGEEKALSTIKSLSPRYNVKIEGIDDYRNYSGYGLKNDDSVFNIVEIACGISAFAKEESVTITISNEYGTYNLGLIKTSEIEGLRYNKEPYIEAMSLIEKEQYKEAIEKLEEYKVLEPDSYSYYECDKKVDECKEALYQKALQAYMNGEYKKALALFENCGDDYRDTKQALNECKEVLGLPYEGKILTLGRTSSGEEIEWIIIKYDEEKSFVLSRNILFLRGYNQIRGYEGEEKSYWGRSGLRNYLNDESTGGFLGSCFTEKELDRIIPSNVETDTETTIDKVFLLSKTEFEELPYEYQYRYASFGDESESWWLRSLSEGGGFLLVASESWFKNPQKISFTYADIERGVRPAMWITLEE